MSPLPQTALSVAAFTSCNAIGPYHAGANANGSYTFTFSNPISGVTINLVALDDDTVAMHLYEEFSIEINGAHYPLTSPGIPNGCMEPAELNAAGNIVACSGCDSSSDGVNIEETINTITVIDTHFGGNAAGVIFSFYFCCFACSTDAGTIASNSLDLCPGETATAPPAGQTVLGSNDILRYILFSDPNDTLGSVLATSAAPSFAFNPATMQTDVTYYIAAVAGDNLNGNVDPNDPCLDFSNAIEATWHTLPSVTFSITDPNVCAGACTTVTANFTGKTPFILTYTTPVSGSVTQTFPGNTGTLQVCTAAGAPPGSFLLQATSLEDRFCTCE